MTQLAALNRAVLPQPPSQGIQDFHLIVLNQSGTQVLNQFSAFKYNGLDREVACAVAPGGAVKTLTFTGLPELVACTGGEIIVFRLNDGDGWKDVFYGAITEGWAAKPSRQPRQYLADAEYLLDGTVTDAVSYPAQDPALIAQDLVRRLRHPALNFNEIDFPQTATTLEGGFEQPGIPLGEALKLLAQSVADSGRTITTGVDGRGFVFFRELSGTLDVPYYPEDYTDLPTNAADTVTAVLWVIGNEPSVPGWSGPYSPSTLTHLSVPDPGLHQRYGRTIASLPPTDNLWIAKPGAAESVFSSSFLNSQNVNDGNPSTFAQRNPANTTSNGYIGVSHSGMIAGEPTYGVRVRYRRGYDATGLSRLQIGFQIETVNEPIYVTSGYLNVPLGYTGDAAQSIDVLFPLSKPVYVDNILGEPVGFYQASGVSSVMQATVYADNIGTYEVYELSFLTLNTSLLDAAAIAELRTPAQEPAQLVLRRAQDRNRVGYYAPALPKVKLETGLSDAAEYRYAFDRSNGVSTVVDLGSPSREGDAALAERIRLAIDTRTRQSEVRTTIGRL